ncbi:GTPase family protein [Thalassoglobus polymorphus]|uniref:G domain-containing protein n=1 Tax=Thalassoglobus polymorphus TaxID=2527994 RepID=A0A517QJ47_9PLAN|nr:GTPase [Thalassoglobus polymorphus]QDT31646.1 hypothetical protein Mal48_08810 [Thalassoglobus polymorphus]
MFGKWFSRQPFDDDEYLKAKNSVLEKAPIPVLWLFGKTGSGKSSVIRELTGVESVEIGSGYRPQTQYSSLYAFPNESEPILKFLDTRGLSEANYDPIEDIVEFEDQAHLMILTVRVMDHALEELLTALKTIRKSAPDRPVILALTALHDAYPGEQHPEVDPFDESRAPLPENINPNLKRSLQQQYKRFEGLFDCAVPLDLTPPHEGFHQPTFGSDRLKRAIVSALPAAYRHQILQMDRILDPLADMIKKKTMPTILGMSGLAATAAAVPAPWVDIPVVMGLQSRLIYKLAKLHGQSIDGRTIAKISGALGGRVAVRMALRESLKFIPWVGMAANAAAAFAMTYATGMAWNWYFTEVSRGHAPTESELREVFQDQFKRAGDLWKVSHQADAEKATE